MKPPHRIVSMPAKRPDTLEDERREVLDSVLHALAEHTPDPDELVVCARLVHHLSAPTARHAA